MNIHFHAANGDAVALGAALANGASIEARDERGRTPLMVAAASPKADAGILQVLLDHGANVNALSLPKKILELDDDARAILEESGIDTSIYDQLEDVDSVLSCAIRTATRDKIRVLLEAGADVNYVNANGYSVLVTAMHRASEDHDAILQMLIDAGAPLDNVSSYGESALSVASHRGKFELVTLLLDRGANPEPLGWAPLFYEVAAGNLAAVARLVDEGAPLDQRDGWGRTPFLLSVHAGHLEVARFLLERGSDRSATGRCGQTALMYAISRDDVTMLEWLIARGSDVEETDEFGNFPLIQAAQESAVGCIQVLLDAGASPARRNKHGSGPIHDAATPDVVRLLVAAGEELSDVDSEMRLRLLDMDLEDSADVSAEDYHRHKHRVFGARTPERMNNALWDMMVRTRISAYACASKYHEAAWPRDPIWCFQRFGQSLTQLPDGRYVEIGGEHEDHYDPDFCIYNDVVVHHGDGTFDIFGYPRRVFPPTDFHSATLRGPHIYIVGSLGYPHERRPGHTPVYRLHCETWSIEPLSCTGDAPGWIHNHRAKLVGDRRLEIRGGLILDPSTGDLIENTNTFLLDLDTFAWRHA